MRESRECGGGPNHHQMSCSMFAGKLTTAGQISVIDILYSLLSDIIYLIYLQGNLGNYLAEGFDIYLPQLPCSRFFHSPDSPSY